MMATMRMDDDDDDDDDDDYGEDSQGAGKHQNSYNDGDEGNNVVPSAPALD